MDDDELLDGYEHELADEPALQMFVGEMRSAGSDGEIDAVTEALLRLWLDLDE